MAEDRDGSVLVVEDDPELRFILMAQLRTGGFEAFEASDGAQAIELASRRQPDLIIMDIGLPTLDGVAATRALKTDPLTTHIPVIMLTGRSKTEDIVRGLEAGAQEYLCKPFDMAELLARARTVYRLAQTRKDLDQLNTKLEAEVGSKTKRLQLLHDFMQDLNRADSRDEILDLIMSSAERITAAKRISLLLKDSSGDNLVCVRAMGIDPAIVKQIRVKKMEGIAGQVCRSGKTLAARTFGSQTESQRDYRQDAFLSTPLVTKLETREGILGVLNVTDRTDDTPFPDDEIESIRSIADAGAIALDNVTRRVRLEQSVGVLLQTVGHLAEYRDEETTRHLERVSKMARILACELRREGPYTSQVSQDFVESLVKAAPMHDIGKVGIPDDILTKPGALTDEEFQIMKTHTDIGRRVLSRALDPTHSTPLLQMCIDIAHAHHERYDGTGYPQRLCGDAIPLAARIIALVDAYDAITSARRYKKARSHVEAVEIVRSESANHFDPVMVEALLRCHDQFDQVRALNDDRIETAAPAIA